MSNDVLVYMCLHSPFALTIILLTWQTPRSSLKIFIFISYAFMHLITVFAYLAKAGDDFAIVTYWLMYLICPALIIYFKIIKAEKDKRNYWKYVPLALFALPFFGVVGIVFSFVLSPPHFH
jgi:hypothetical protein